MSAESPSFSSGFENFQITPLTGLRGIAASLVVAYHFHANEPSAIQPFLRKAGFLGIAIFFALSGYILTHLYFADFSTGIALKKYYNYMVKRIARIYPLHIMLLTFVLILYPRFINPDLSKIKQLFGNLTLTHAWGLSPFSFVEASWTISVEFLFYLILPFLILMLNPKRAMIVLLIMIPLYAFILARVIPIPLGIEPYVNHRVFTYGSFFVFGVATWHIAQIPYIAKAIDKNIVFIGGCILVAVTTFCPSDLAVYLVSAISIPLIIRSAHTSKAGNVLLGFSPFVWLGVISYSLYLSHQLIQRLVQQVNQESLPEPFYKWASIYCLILLWSTFSFYKIEKPARASIRKHFLKS